MINHGAVLGDAILYNIANSLANSLEKQIKNQSKCELDFKILKPCFLKQPHDSAQVL